MKSVLACLLLAATAGAFAQGSGAPNPKGQAISPEGASAAEKAVEAKHDKRVAKKAAKKARAASAAASQ